MGKRVQFIRHSTGAADNFTGKEAEITVDKTKKELRVHDGLTAGGTPVARADLDNVSVATSSLAGKMSAGDKVELTAATTDIAQEIADRITDVDAEETRAIAVEDAEQAARIAADSALQAILDGLNDRYMPVGTLHISTNSANPATYFGFGTWVQTARGRSLVGEGTSDAVFAAAAQTGQSSTPDHAHTDNFSGTSANTGSAGPFQTAQTFSSGSAILVTDNVAIDHNHAITINGGVLLSGAHSNVQPSEVFYVWKRTV